MYSEARKIDLLQKVLKVTNEDTLIELENVIEKSKKNSRRTKKKPSIYDFMGTFTKEEANEMKRVIEITCGTVNPDDWK